MRREQEEATQRLERETESFSTEPLKMDYRTLAALPSSAIQRVNRDNSSESPVVGNSGTREFCSSPTSQ
ncbi:hypothetical protein chiPu_0022031, partial [Chiloscyllium punctatum]|nr:hypothetical protein [Chiloscyllium punctatum]